VSQNDPHEPVTVTDKRRIDPNTYEARSTASGPAPSGPAPEAAVPSASDAEAELIADLQRVQADFANYRKRSLRDQQIVGERAKAAVVVQLLPVLDDLDRARSHGDLDGGPLKSVADKLSAALAGLGLSSFGSEGDAFDPSLHEAVQHEGDGSNPVIGTVMRRGYRLGEQVLRHALVGVVDSVDDGNAVPAGNTGAGDGVDADTPGNEPGSGAQNAESNQNQ
jgi:molecular chaperone GrpE